MKMEESNKGIRGVFEMLKFKVNGSYKSNNNSPEKMEQELKHIKEILSKDLNYFKEIPEELLLFGEKEGVELSENGILQYAFKMGFTIENMPPKLFKNVKIRNKIIHQSIIQQGSIVNVVNVLKARGRGNEEILNVLSDASNKLIAQNPILFDELLTYSGTQTLQTVIDKIFMNNQLNEMFKEELPDKVARLKELYENYPTMLEYVSSKILLPPYKRISLHKLQLIVRIPKMRSTLINMNNYELELYARMSSDIKESSNGWQEFENNILLNFKQNTYKELINDLMEKSKLDEKMTREELQKLTSLFIGYSIDFQSGNTFNITRREELRNFDHIKELTCDIVLKNPKLDDEEIIKPIMKYLKSFISLSMIDRMKMAILEKYYNLSLKEAEAIIRTFGDGIEELEIDDVEEKKTVEIIKSIKEVCKCHNIDVLKSIKCATLTDLSQSILLRQNIRSIYQKMYQDTLYQIDEKDRKGNVYYDGKSIPVYYPEENFAMLVKRIIPNQLNEVSYEETWEELGKPLRYKTSVSYMTPENLLDMKGMCPQIIFGFSANESYSIDEMYNKDNVTPFLSGDELFIDEYDSKYEAPSKLNANTYGGYNELVINTLLQNKEGRMEKTKPSYIVYIQENQKEDKESNQLWKASLKAAKDFRIPIVVLDREKIRQQQREQITNKYLENRKADDRLLAQIYHYIERYGRETLEDVIPMEIMEKVSIKYQGKQENFVK